jgi:hypothetical protein
MKRFFLTMLALLGIGCGEGLKVPAPDALPAAVGSDPSVCCVFYEATSEWQTCWGCGDVVICVGVPCIEGIPSCQAGAARSTGQGAASYPAGGVPCLQ